MSRYLFLLGHTPELSLAEIKALLSDVEVKQVNRHLAEVSLESDEQAEQLQTILGGVFKILKVIKPLADDAEKAKSQIVDFLKSKDQKILFGITSLAQARLKINATDLKNKLKKHNKQVRYRRTEKWGLSTAILSHEPDYFDLLIFQQDDQLFLAQTIAFQPLEQWVNRDRNMPYTAGKKGMLPPKLARTMVNLGLGRLNLLGKEPPVLYDPFCGTGTVLIEGLLRGCRAIGSDLNQEAVAGTERNLAWFEQQADSKFDYELFQADAAHVDKLDWEVKVDLIVTEPFLGKPNPKKNELPNIFQGLTSLYLGAFKTWAKILAKQALVVIVFPQVTGDNKEYNLLALVDKLTQYGYTLEADPIDYGYEKATVKRQIMVFSYQADKKK